MKFSRRQTLASFASLAVAPFGCSDIAADTFDRNVMLSRIALDVITPTAREVVMTQSALAATLTALANEPTESALLAARAAWVAARVPLRRAKVFTKGPYDTLGIRSALDYAPNATAIERVLVATSTPNLDTLGADARGTPAIEYLLFTPDQTNEALIGLFRNGTGAANRRAYITGLGGETSSKARAYANAWDPTMGNFAREFSEAGRGSTTYPTTRVAVDLVINEMIGALDYVSSNSLGKALGTRDGGTPHPELVESLWSGNSIADLRSILEGVEAFQFSQSSTQSSPRIGALVASRSTATERTLRTATTSALTAVAAIQTPLQTAVTTSLPAVTAAHSAVRVWKRVLQVDVANLFGVAVSIGVNDTD
jgi:predicted lipoprotein